MRCILFKLVCDISLLLLCNALTPISALYRLHSRQFQPSIYCTHANFSPLSIALTPILSIALTPISALYLLYACQFQPSAPHCLYLQNHARLNAHIKSNMRSYTQVTHNFRQMHPDQSQLKCRQQCMLLIPSWNAQFISAHECKSNSSGYSAHAQLAMDSPRSSAPNDCTAAFSRALQFQKPKNIQSIARFNHL